MGKVYLDYASKHPVCKSILENIKDMTELFYNASSAYDLGIYNRHVVEKVREKVAKMINANPEEIIFTSCASEANTLAIEGFLKANDDYNVISTNVEHNSIMLNKNINEYIKCDKNGFIDPELFDGYGHTLFSVMYANNELGSINNIKEISKIAHEYGNYIFSDATAAFGHIPIDVKDLGVDMMSFSAQKIGGIMGCGVLYIKKGVNIAPLICGHQNSSLRGGTYNELAIKCFGLALDEINYSNEQIIRVRRNYLVDLLLAIDGVHLNGILENRLSNNINIRIDNLSIDNQQLVSLLDLEGYMISAGSACNSGNATPSHVLKAIGLSDNQANSSIRITIGYETSVRELEDFVNCLNRIVTMYRQ